MATTLSRISSYLSGWLPRSQRTLENPSTPLSDPDGWLFEAFGAEDSASGVRVNAEIALKYAPWWRGINLISRDVGKLPLIVYKRVGAGKEVDRTHFAFPLLRYRANNELLSAFTFKQTLQGHAMSYGNGYAWIRRDGGAKPLELIVLNPLECWPFRENGRLWYAVRVGYEMRRVNPTEIFHIKGLSPDGLVGYSVYQKAKESIGEGRAAQEFGSRFFRNAARPSVVIEVPGTMTDEAQRKFRENWERMQTGLNNSHRTAILTNNATLKPISANAKDSDLTALRKFNLVDIANFVGVPVHKVGGEGRTAFASLEQENQAYLDESLDPWLVCWEFEAREKLLTEDQKNNDTHVIEFNRNALVRADITSRFNAYQTGIRAGIYNVDEVRSKENMNPLPDGKGQNFFAPLELQVLGDNEPPEVDDLPALLSITEAVATGAIPHDSAKAMLNAAFPLLSDSQINDIIDPIEVPEPDEPTDPPEVLGDIPPDDTMPPAPPPQPTGAARRVIVDAMRRACTHLTIHAVRRAKRANNFLDSFESERSEDEARVSEIIDAPVELCVSIGGTPCDAVFVARMAMDEVKSALLTATESVHTQDSRDDLAASVETRMTALSETLPDMVADYLLLNGAHNGTSLSAE